MIVYATKVSSYDSSIVLGIYKSHTSAMVKLLEWLDEQIDFYQAIFDRNEDEQSWVFIIDQLEYYKKLRDDPLNESIIDWCIDTPIIREFELEE